MKNKLIKKLLVITAAITTITLTIPATSLTVHAETNTCIEGDDPETTEVTEVAYGVYQNFFRWALTGEENDLTLTISGEGTLHDPSEVTVSRRPDPFKPYFGQITKIVFAEGIENIPNNFCGYIQENSNISMTNLKEIEMANSVTSIGYCAFAFHHNLKKVKLSKNIIKIGNRAFLYCENLNLGDITWPTSECTYELLAFDGCIAQRLTLPNNMINDAIHNTTRMEYNFYPFSRNLQLSELYVPANITAYNGSLPDNYDVPSIGLFTMASGTYLKKLTWLPNHGSHITDHYILPKDHLAQHINANTVIYTTENNPILTELASVINTYHPKVVEIEPSDDLGEISDDNVDVSNQPNHTVSRSADDEMDVAILGSTQEAIIRLSVPTEVAFVISPQTESKFVTKPFKVINVTGSPIVFTVKDILPKTTSDDLKLLPRNYENRNEYDWLHLNAEETKKGIALKCDFDPNGGDNYTETLWEHKLSGDTEEIRFEMDTDAYITGKLGGMYGLAWDDTVTGEFKLHGTVSI